MSTNKAAALMRFLERRVKNGEAAGMDPRLVECAVKNAQESLSEWDTVRVESRQDKEVLGHQGDPALNCTKDVRWPDAKRARAVYPL